MQTVRMKPGMSHPELQVSILFYINIVLNKDVPLIWDTKELLLEKKITSWNSSLNSIQKVPCKSQ